APGGQCGSGMGFLHNSVNVAILDPVANSQPYSGEAFAQAADLQNACLFATDDADPQVYFFPKPSSGQCPSTKPSNAKVLGNPSFTFRIVGLPSPKKLALDPTMKSYHAGKSFESEQGAAGTLANKLQLALSRAEIGTALAMSHHRDYLI